MACACEDICQRDEFRCACERDCWAGHPEDYEECIEACAPCDFPELGLLPSQGYRCIDHPSPEYSECATPCEEAITEGDEACELDYNSCLGGCIEDPECAEACEVAKCNCDAGVADEAADCLWACDETIAWPEAFACARAELEAAETCCDTDLGDCLRECDDTWIDAAEPIEYDLLDCSQDGTITGTYVPGEGCSIDGGMPPDCRAAWIEAIRAHDHNRAVCRARCERNERYRHAPAERKHRECGGNLDLCNAICAADKRSAVRACDAALLICLDACGDASTCRGACVVVWRGCWSAADSPELECRLACCTAEFEYAPNDHARAECDLPCLIAFREGKVACANEVDTCITDCFEDCNDDPECEEGCLTECEGEFCQCIAPVNSTYEACREACALLPGDCPDCFEAVEVAADAAHGPPGGGPYYSVENPAPFVDADCPEEGP